MDLKKEKNRKLIRVLVFNVFVIVLFLTCAFFIAKTKNSSAATSNVQQVRSVNVKNTNKFLYPVIDTCSTMNQGITKTQLDATMSRLKNMGFNKVYIVLMPDDYPSLTMTSIKPLSASLGGSYSKNEISIQSLGNNPNKVFLEYAHKYGLEAIAIYKPYEGGGGSTIPSSSVPQFSNYVENRVSENTVGGKRLYFERFVSQNLNLRVKRIENQQEKANSKLAINKIEMNFYNSSRNITNGMNLNTLNDYENNKMEKPTLWISEDNGKYYVYDNFTYAYSFHDGYEIRDVNNFPTGQTKDVLRLTINIRGLKQKYRYVVVTFNRVIARFKKIKLGSMLGM